jgi:ATP-binding cassette subfamily B protein
LAKPEWPRLAGATAFLALGSAMALAYPQMIRRIIDGVLGAGDGALIDRAALVMVAIFAVQGAAMALRMFLFTVAGERIVARLRADVYRAIIAQEIAFFDERRTGELTNRLASDAGVLQSTVTANLSMLLRNGAQIVGGIALLLWTSPRLTLLMLSIVPAIAIAAVVIGRRIRRLSRKVQDALAESNEIAEETIAGIRTVRAFTAEEHEAVRYAGAVDRSFALARRRSIFAATFMGIGMFAGYGAVAIVLWSGGHLVLEGAMTVGGLTSFVLYTLIVAFSLGAVGELWTDFMRAAGAAERIFDLIDRAPAIPLRGGVSPQAIRGAVVFSGVRFAYPTRKDVPVLTGIELRLEPGEVVALVGPSGAGKSTIAALLARLYDPDAGAISLDGVDLRTLDPGWLRRQIGAVAQEPILFSASIAENIRYGREGATDAEVEAAARAANAHDFISAFPDGYATQVGERGVQLSGGQKQRVAIARAVLKDPRLLVLDEATSALDAESEHAVKEALDRLMRGRTTLIIAHRLSTVIDADRVLVLDGGKVVQSGKHAALMSEEGLYRRLVERQAQGALIGALQS